MMEEDDSHPHPLFNNYPVPVQRRINALKNLQIEYFNIECDFYKKLHELECMFESKYKPLYAKRTEIVKGSYEPTDTEATLDCVSLLDEIKKKLNINGQAEQGDATVPEQLTGPGIPDFWLTVFRNVELLADMIQEHDEPILKCLTDIELKLSNEPMEFALVFQFEPNEYFTNTSLTKHYVMKCQPDKEDPFSFEGPEIIGCRGCKIDWKPGKNVTVKLIKKKQKHKQRGATRFVTKQVKADSFFNFFEPPPIPPEDQSAETVDQETKDLLNADFEIGQILRDRIIPQAVLYFTGEAVEDESYDDEDIDEDEEEGEIEDEEGETDSEEEEKTPVKGQGRKGKGGADAAKGGGDEEQAKECKQQ